jgi:hypothetical protein
MVPNSLDKIQTSSFLQELKHICSKEATILKKKSDPTNPAKFNTEEFHKIKKSDNDDANQEAST